MREHGTANPCRCPVRPHETQSRPLVELPLNNVALPPEEVLRLTADRSDPGALPGNMLLEAEVLLRPVAPLPTDEPGGSHHRDRSLLLPRSLEAFRQRLVRLQEPHT